MSTDPFRCKKYDRHEITLQYSGSTVEVSSEILCEGMLELEVATTSEAARVTLTPDEARTVAALLIAAADGLEVDSLQKP